ncbi:hypothetical protein ABIB96_001252 [Bradyrhizobium sp. LA3.X]|uniref:hypothetical protein n=1 Tax=unclassified Bradyrhizobium TaxID=2631580 RepID=UPI00339A3B5D
MAKPILSKERILNDIADACEGLTPLESALLIAEAFRQVYGGEWKIEVDVSGKFTVVAFK